MTYVDTTQRDDYTATSGQTVFAYTFRILVNTDLKVYNDNILQTLTTHYTVSGVGTAGGGNVTFVTGVTLNNAVLIIRDTPDTQSADYTVGGLFPAETHEQALDKLAMKGQDLDEKMGRTVKFPITSTLSDIDFPEGTSATDRKTKVVAWDSVGTDLELIASTNVDATSVIAVKGDIVQGDASGDAAKLAIGSTGGILHVVSGLLAYLGIGSANDVMQVIAGQPSWVTNPTIVSATLTTPTINTPTINTPTITSPSTDDLTVTGTSANPPDTNTITKDLLVAAAGQLQGTGTITWTNEVNFGGTLTDNGTGDYTITLENAMLSAGYSIFGSAGASLIISFTSYAAGSIDIIVKDDAGNATDNSRVSIIIVGQQS